MRVPTVAEASYAYWKSRRSVLLDIIEGLTIPNVMPGTEESAEWREQRLACLDAECMRLEEMDAKVERFAVAAGVPEQYWRRN